MVEEISTALNAVVTCLGCQLSFMLKNVDSNEKFEEIISPIKDRTVYIPIDTVCDECCRNWHHNKRLTPLYVANMTVKAGDIATALLGNDVTQSKTISLVSHEIQSTLKQETEVVELQVECGSEDLNVTKVPYVSGRMLLQIYGRP